MNKLEKEVMSEGLHEICRRLTDMKQMTTMELVLSLIVLEFSEGILELPFSVNSIANAIKTTKR